MINEDFIIADLHIHSRFSRACSKNITFENLVKYARIKGLNLLGTGDFTHPEWFKEIKEKFIDKKKGIYYYNDFPFLITGEISLMYTQGHGRRVHLVVLVPNLEVAEKINSYLDTKGRRDYDGRPIFKISCEEFVREMRRISENIEIIPAHIWTPWFGIFGSRSGFDSLREAFGGQVEHIHSIETGISSDPPMNWKIKELDGKSIVSFSDSHSYWPWRIGRESTIFKKTDSYSEIIRQIRENDFIATIETDPGYGIYHYDGHRNCNFSCSPSKTKELNGICPVCKRSLTIGVEYRVEELTEKNRQEDFKPEGAKPYYKLLPLHELISLAIGKGIETSGVWQIYNHLIKEFENEFNVLLDVSKEDMMKIGINDELIELILKNRVGKIKVKPGYDGLYGKAIMGEKQVKLS
ncbi:MAG: endonuclease Q family protein [Nanoarchaeota archaeon]|nr:endonuclease Q family protein [Nanoarchaeota archaeon]MBU1028215.1 endonuclease Q family protein [Nanoarchaeota archaeon]